MSICMPEEEAKSLQQLGEFIKKKKIEEERGTRKPTRQELVARSNARPKIVLKREVTPTQVTIVESKQVARDKVSPAGRVMGREMVTIVTRRKVPARDFLSVGAWGF